MAIGFELARDASVTLTVSASHGPAPLHAVAVLLFDADGRLLEGFGGGWTRGGTTVSSSLVHPDPVVEHEVLMSEGDVSVIASGPRSAGRYVALGYGVAESMDRLLLDVETSVGAGRLLGASEGSEVFVARPADAEGALAVSALVEPVGAQAHLATESRVRVGARVAGLFGPGFPRPATSACEFEVVGPSGSLGRGCGVTFASPESGEYRFLVHAYAEAGLRAGEPLAHGAAWRFPALDP